MVVADTSVLIASIRGNELAQKILSAYFKQGICISIITAMELNAGATNAKQKATAKKVTDIHEILHINKHIGQLALRLLIVYNNNRQVLSLGDALIAATCLHHNHSLITFNTKDFKNIKGLQLVK